MTWQTVPICDSCWVAEEGTRIPYRVRATPDATTYETGTCYHCGFPTRGIYVRRDVP